MPPRRSNAGELARLLDSAAQPIYVLDEDLTIVFLNRACREWLGTSSEKLLGERCAYHSEPAEAGPESVAAGLCPPPAALSGEVVEATVSRPAECGKFAERRASFFPVGGDRNAPIAIVAVLGEMEDRTWSISGSSPVPVPFSDADSSESGPIALHEHICRFRREIAARCRADRLIGNGPAMRLVRSQVELAASCRSSVLLVGPPGSGRRRLAAAIHYGRGGEKGDIPHPSALVTLDCSLLGADLPEALASAAAKASAHGADNPPGTLLLHRVDELTADVQVQAADFLAGRLSAWRLMATAAGPLAELSRRGKFHSGLAAMLGTLVVELPPLAGRREDIPLLAQLFLEERNAAGGRQIGGFSPAALDRLDAYHWPGNLDELAEVVAEAHRRAAGREIDAADLPERLRLSAQAAAHPRRVDESIVLDEFLGRVERELIRRALARSKGNKARAARLLGVTRPRLYRRMMQLGLE